MTAATDARIAVTTTADALSRDGLAVLRPWHDAMLRLIAAEAAARVSGEAEQLARGVAATQAAMRQGLQGLAGLAATSEAAAHDTAADADWRAVARVAAATGIEVPPSPAPPALPPGSERLALMLDDSGLRRREVLLRDGWWAGQNGPLLGIAQRTGAAVALLPDRGGYRLWNPGGGGMVRVDADVAATVSPTAWMFYRALPNAPIRLGDVVRISLAGAGPTARRAAVLAVLGGLLGLAAPAATGVLVDRTIPSSDRGQITVIAVGLCAAAFGAACLKLSQSLALQQLEARLDINAQPALFDRLLRLPVTFFKRFGAGDLADRVMGIQTIRQMLVGSALSGAIGGLTSVLNLEVMLSCDAELALAGLAAAVATTAAGGAVAAVQLRRERALARQRGVAENFVLQAISGVAKLKAAAATGRAFAIWARLYAAQRRNFIASQQLANLQRVLTALLVPLATAGLFLVGSSVAADLAKQAAAAATDPAQEPVGAFGLAAWAAFSAAFGQLTGGLGSVVSAVTGLLGVVPHYERVRPLLEIPPEAAGPERRPGLLSGAIELASVSFAYGDGPPVLQDLSLSIRPGEFVAIVGPSGSGKSTILRLLLGFEAPTRGEVLFDGRSVGDLDMAAVRRQVGVVLQNGRLQPGSLLSNIGAGRPIALEDAWQAARLAGLEADTKAMPMGMNTVLTDGGSTLSGGQRQRLMIARALARKPRILLLDEATSALDNRTQSIVTETVAALGLTRVVIAHRLSTIEMVDRVLVIDRGQLVQSGTFRALMESPGLFQDLARRQML